MINLKDLIFRISESTINRVEDVSRDDILVGENGLNFLKAKINEINKKAVKWGLEPVKLEILKEENIKTDADDLDISEFKKQYTVRIIGKSPQVEGYEFIAKIEHTDSGNLINISPDASVSSLPDEYRDADSICDVCKTKRERHNTFIIKDVKENKLLTVGSGCLKRFLPIDSVSKVIRFAEILEELRGLSEEEIESGADGMGGVGSSGNYYDIGEIVFYLSLAYLTMGKKYISKKKAREVADTTGEYLDSTADVASNIMFYRRNPNSKKTPDFINRAEEMKPEAKEMSDRILDWIKTHDFKSDAEKKPEMANYFNNLAVLSKSSTVSIKNLGYMGGLLVSYLIDKEMIKKRDESEAQIQSEFVGAIGQKLSIDVTVTSIRGYESAYGYMTIYNFKDDLGNLLVWFSSNNIGIEENKKYSVVGTVKDHKVGDQKYGSKKQTILTRVKAKDYEGNKINEGDLMLEYHQIYVNFFSIT